MVTEMLTWDMPYRDYAGQIVSTTGHLPVIAVKCVLCGAIPALLNSLDDLSSSVGALAALLASPTVRVLVGSYLQSSLDGVDRLIALCARFKEFLITRQPCPLCTSPPSCMHVKSYGGLG
jgi:hypothetical protein